MEQNTPSIYVQIDGLQKKSKNMSFFIVLFVINSEIPKMYMTSLCKKTIHYGKIHCYEIIKLIQIILLYIVFNSGTFAIILLLKNRKTCLQKEKCAIYHYHQKP